MSERLINYLKFIFSFANTNLTPLPASPPPPISPTPPSPGGSSFCLCLLEKHSKTKMFISYLQGVIESLELLLEELLQVLHFFSLFQPLHLLCGVGKHHKTTSLMYQVRETSMACFLIDTTLAEFLFCYS